MANFKAPSWLDLAGEGEGEGDNGATLPEGLLKENAADPATEPAGTKPPNPAPTEDFEAVRRERETLKAQVEELRGTVQRFSNLGEDLKRFREENQQLLAQRDKAQEPAPLPVDEEAQFRDNPLNYLREQIKTLRQDFVGVNAEALKERQQLEQRSKEQQQVEDFATAVRREVADYRKTNPHYDQALSFITERRINELRDLGAHDDQIEQAIYQDGLRLAATAKQAGKNIGDYITGIAKIWGWQQEAPPQEKAQAKENVLDIQDSIRRMNEKRAASSTVTGQGSATKKTALEAIGEMSDQEFDEFWQEFETQSKQADRMFQIKT